MHSLFAVILLTVHMMLALALIGVVLLQRSEGGMGGLGGGGMSGFMTTRGTANLLTRTTRWLAGAFMVMSMVLAIIAVNQDHASKPPVSSGSPVEAPAPPAPEQSGGATPESTAPANNAPETGSTTEQAPATGTTPSTGATPSAPSVPTNQ